MESAQVQTTTSEEQVRAGVLAALTPFGATAEQNQAGLLELVTGSVGAAYAAGAFRAEEKMPMRITVATAGGGGGTGVSIQVASRGGGGFLSGGIWGMKKARRAEKTWLDRTVAAVQPVTGGMGPQQPQPTPAPTQPMPPTPPSAPPGPPGPPPPAAPPPAQPPGPPPTQPPQAPSV